LSNALKIAFLSRVWASLEHRLFAGALRFANANPPMSIRSFSPMKNAAKTISQLENWGAKGILCSLEDRELDSVLAATKPPLPIVNNLLAKEKPGVLQLGFDWKDTVQLGVNHFRQLGLRSMALCIPEELPRAQELIINPFLQFAHTPVPSQASLMFQVEVEQLRDPYAPVGPVPAVLSTWLHSLPKPTGILCTCHGSGGYLIRCCQALGFRVPEDFAVIGEDDMESSLASEPTLTTTVPAYEKEGFEAARLLQEWIAGKKPSASVVRLHDVELQVRGSTGLRKPEICDIAGALKYIDQNACRGITVEQVIKETQSVSEPTFHRRFREMVGKSPAEAIRNRKLDEVRRLLASTNMPLTMVSDLAGFSSYLFLSKVFREVEGVTMSDYRKRERIHSSHPHKAAQRPSAKL
jgi:DNA-binding LacI/PurR family transcriptional regulator/AraC-like DNA-binding protein